MPNEAHAKLCEKLVYQHLCHVTDEETAWVLLQEPGFIGFGVVRQDKIFWPPYPDRPKDWTPDWARVSDLRLFGEKGEWHVWPHWDGNWKSRLWKLDKVCDSLTEYHALWGNDVLKCEEKGWIKLVEERGVELWLPLAEKELTAKDDLPLRLEIRQIIGYDDATEESSHLVGVVDAVLVALVTADSEEPLLPTNVSPPSP